MLDTLRDLLAQDYKHKHVDDARCITCGRSDLPVALHVIEFYQPESAQLPPLFVPMSASRGTLRGSIPVCSACCPPCGTCLLPVVTPWIRRVVAALVAQHSGVGVSVGNGYCRHVHVMADLRSLFRPVRLASRPLGGSGKPPGPSAAVSTKWRARPFHHNKSRDDEAQWFANAPGWNLIDSRLIAVLIDRLHGNPMFEVFVHASQDCDVVSKYVDLNALFDRGVGEVAALPRVAAILGASGAEHCVKFSELLKSKSTSEKVLGRFYENALNACQASVHVEPNYVLSYVHLAVLRSMVNQGADALAFCSKGLEAVARLRRAPFHRSELPAIKNAGQDLDEIERRLMSIKASLRP